ncbi:MAG: orotidine-5'-phosphate decarboxylase [Betaproteobacteria bacterium]|nr:orotidine-5'-phosphate decarboxylase [Betaproteobacteria bacterium]MDE2124507.1 orotidine-5'-phosphate decarboxylase [Betaproteobacteria bacterium]MDE2187289.1 orotidine-5'-phosphate decarboxylase [Betaproteobacteria bacterium]MDE2325260.1 orotidine-5'-phosphate decarboxylase [Betaproteobacteria bacterium]
MTFIDQWLAASKRNASSLCVGLDPEPERLPAPWTHDTTRLFDFCAAIVDATADLVCAYKPQIAHFAAVGAEAQLEKLIVHIHRSAPGVPVILDAKRGDIGSTARHYAREAFERFGADALTVSPLMGADSLGPYIDHYPERGLFVLCRTSNPGGEDLQALQIAADASGQSEQLFERVARLATGPWNRSGQIGLVTGATRPGDIARIRAIAPDAPLLIPGIGAQGGDVLATVHAARHRYLINASRSVLYAGNGADFAKAARAEVLQLRAAIAAVPG